MMPRTPQTAIIVLWFAAGCGSTGSGASERSGSSGGTGTGNAGGSAASFSGGSGAGGSVSGSGSDSGGTDTQPTGPISASVASWPENRRGAYSIIHDDTSPWLSSHFETAGPELSTAGLVAAFGVIVSACNDGEVCWAEVQALKDAGHEIINHSWDHTGSTSAADLGLQMDRAGQEVDANLTGQKTSFYIFPYDDHDPAAVEHLRGLGYLGARAGIRGGITAPDYTDDFALSFDVFGPANSMYEDTGPCAGQSGGVPLDFTEECRRYVLNQYVDDIISQDGWGIREFHGVEDASWESVPLADYQNHLTYVKSKKDAALLWVDTPSNIIGYRRARASCAPTVQDYTLKFLPLGAECQSQVRPLDIVITVHDGAMNTVNVMQNGVTLAATPLGAGKFVIKLDPSRGDATVTTR